jgi:hypothetical protein
VSGGDNGRTLRPRGMGTATMRSHELGKMPNVTHSMEKKRKGALRRPFSLSVAPDVYCCLA